jgi:hypothetical protein
MKGRMMEDIVLTTRQNDELLALLWDYLRAFAD